jgi:hypothetical protein
MSVTDRILSALTTVIRMNDKVEDMAGLMKEQQRRIDDLNTRMVRLETVLEIALNRSAQPIQRLAEQPLAGSEGLEGRPVPGSSGPRRDHQH